MEESKKSLVEKCLSLCPKFTITLREHTSEHDDLFTENGVGTLALNYCKELNTSLYQAAEYLFNISDVKPKIPFISTEVRSNIESEYNILFGQASSASTTVKNYSFTQYLIHANSEESIKYKSNNSKLSSIEFDYAIEILNIFFYSQHAEIQPVDKLTISDINISELNHIIDGFCDLHNKKNTSFVESVWEYIDNYKEQSITVITEIPSNSFFNLPVSKPWRRQPEIALYGQAGLPVNVGKKTAAGELYIEAIITNKDGGPLELDELDKNVQRAIGNLIDAVGGQLPISITPQQIYRAYARLSPTATVTVQQAKEMEIAMDKLITAPGRIDYRKQLEKHKNIKQQADYDYTSPNAGYESGTLITGTKKAVRSHDGTWTTGYMIYEYPMFYKYSHVIGQMAKIPNVLLTGGTKPVIKQGTKAGIQGSARSVAIKANILTQVKRMQERKKNKKSYTPIIRADDVGESCGITLTDKSRRTLLKNIALYLNDLVTAEEIKSYSEEKNGRKIVGYKITI